MEAFPNDFNQNLIDEISKLKKKDIDMEQKKLQSEFRFNLYKNYKDLLNEESDDSFRLEFTFPKEMSEKSRLLLLNEIIERFKNIYYIDSGYVSVGWSKMKELNAYHYKYAICSYN